MVKHHNPLSYQSAAAEANCMILRPAGIIKAASMVFVND